MNNSKKKGFTIIELLAAIVIVGILASVASIVINRYILQGHNTVDNQLEKQLVLAAKSYYSDNENAFKNTDENGVIIWYTTLKANDYITNDLKDSNGNSCSKSYTVLNDNKYTACIICDNDGYKKLDSKLCTDSLDNHISCEWKDVGEIKLGIKSGTNTATLELSCRGNGIKFSDGATLNASMFETSGGSVGNIVYTPSTGSDGKIKNFTAKVEYTATNANNDKGSVTFNNFAYVVKNSGDRIYNEDVTYDKISIDSNSPSCELTGPYKDSTLNTSVKSVKNGSTVYYGISCSDDNGILNIDSLTSDTIKNGFESSSAVSNLVVSNLNKSADKKTINATISVTVTNPNINSSNKVFDLSLAFKENIIFDSFKNGNERSTSKINGKDTVLSIDDQGPSCAFNGPASNAEFIIKKSKLDVTNDDNNEYVFYELRCTDENSIDPSTFKFSDIKSTEFGRIEQSGNMLEIKNNDNIVIGYRYLIKAYEKNISSFSKPIEAYLTFNESNVKDSTGNSGSSTKESLHVKMIDGKSVPTCNLSVSYSNGYAVLTGKMSSQSGLKGYAFSTDSGEVSSYTSTSGTSATVSENAYSNGVYYLHMIDENDLTGYCMTSSYVYLPAPDSPYLRASDGISSGDWHKNNYSLTASGSGSNVTYYYGTSEYSMTSSQPYVSSETSGTTYYAKACWSNNSNICSSSVEYLALLDKTPPTCEYTTSKLNPRESYTPGNWTQRNVEVKFTNRYDALSGVDYDNTYIQGYDNKWPNYYQTTVGNMSSRNHTAIVKCTDNAGNVTSHNVPIKIDTTPPRVSWSVRDGATVYVDDYVYATCVENESGLSGISGGIYINDAGPYGNASLSTGKGSVRFTTTGKKELYFVCIDTVGNTSHDDYSYSNPKITVNVKKKTYFWSSQNQGSGSCYGNCCSSSPSTCSESTHGQIKYTGCSAEKETTYSYDWEYYTSGSSRGKVKGSSGAWCRDNGYSATYAGCSGRTCRSSIVGDTCRTSSGGNGSKVYCTINKCTRSSSTSYTGYYNYTGSYKCLYKIEG